MAHMHTSKPKKGRCCLKNGAFQAASSGGLSVGLPWGACLPAAVHRKTAANSAKMRMLLHDKTPFFQSSKPVAIDPNS
jgi:hypothetical protein